MMTRPCVVTTNGPGSTSDELGNEIPDQSAVQTLCEIQQHTTREPDAEGEISESDWLGFFPPGTAINTASSVDAEGLGAFQVVGAPMPWDHPVTRVASHIEVRLNRTAGADDLAGS